MPSMETFCVRMKFHLFFFNWWLTLIVRLKRIVYEGRQPQTLNCLIIKKFLEELTEVSIIINKI